MAETWPTWDVGVAFSGAVSGVWTVGRSQVGGADVVGGSFGNNVFDDISSDVRGIRIARGKASDLGAMESGRCTLVLKDSDGTYSPENPASSLAGYLVPMRPLRVRAQLQDYRRTVLNDSPVAYWRLGESSGTRAYDESGNARHGTYAGGVTLGEAGALTGDVDTAAEFNGSTGYVTVPDAAALRFGTADFSLEFWFRRAAGIAASEFFLAKPGTGVATSWDCDLTDAGAIRSRVGSVTIESAGGLDDGATHHVVISVDRGGNGQIYVDGAASGSPQAVGTGDNLNNGEPIQIARRVLGSYFAGRIDEVALYTTALSAARILVHYNAGLATGGDLETFERFYGFIESIEHDPETYQSTIVASDLFERLATNKPTIASTGQVSAGAGIGYVLDELGWTQPSMRALDDGHDIPDLTADGSDAGSQLIEDIRQADQGLFFVDGSGVTQYHELSRRHGVNGRVRTLSASLRAGGPRPSTSVRRIANRLTVTRTGGTPQTASNEASHKAYDWRDGAAVSSDYLLNDSQAGNLANWLVGLQKDPQPPTKRLVLANKTQAYLRQQLAMELNQEVVATVDANGNTVQGWVDALEHEAVGKLLVTRFAATKRTKTIWTVSQSAVGGSHVVGY